MATALKQQLRLRGKKLTGNNAQLVERLSERSSSANGAVVVEDNDSSGSKGKSKGGGKKSGERVAEARARGADVVDFSDFIDA